jgi:hypothetical protein
MKMKVPSDDISLVYFARVTDCISESKSGVNSFSRRIPITYTDRVHLLVEIHLAKYGAILCFPIWQFFEILRTGQLPMIFLRQIRAVKGGPHCDLQQIITASADPFQISTWRFLSGHSVQFSSGYPPDRRRIWLEYHADNFGEPLR